MKNNYNLKRLKSKNMRHNTSSRRIRMKYLHINEMVKNNRTRVVYLPLELDLEELHSIKLSIDETVSMYFISREESQAGKNAYDSLYKSVYESGKGIKYEVFTDGFGHILAARHGKDWLPITRTTPWWQEDQ